VSVLYSSKWRPTGIGCAGTQLHGQGQFWQSPGPGPNHSQRLGKDLDLDPATWHDYRIEYYRSAQLPRHLAVRPRSRGPERNDIVIGSNPGCNTDGFPDPVRSDRLVLLRCDIGELWPQ
jgi:hypothetical protein